MLTNFATKIATTISPNWAQGSVDHNKDIEILNSLQKKILDDPYSDETYDAFNKAYAKLKYRLENFKEDPNAVKQLEDLKNQLYETVRIMGSENYGYYTENDIEKQYNNPTEYYNSDFNKLGEIQKISTNESGSGMPFIETEFTLRSTKKGPGFNNFYKRRVIDVVIGGRKKPKSTRKKMSGKRRRKATNKKRRGKK
jgi:hypothetical protein